MAASTDAMYNAESRYIHERFLIYFTSVPLEVTKSNYLVSSSVLEESSKLSDSPFGTITSNELALSLFNESGLFNPQNTSSSYYGQIKKGIKIEAFIRPDEVNDWDPLGVFYVTNWSTNSSGMIADIVANDALYNVLNGSVPSLPVFRNVPVSLFMISYFELFNLSVSVDTSIDTVIPYIYSSVYSDNKELLSDVLNASLCECFCDHNGNIVVSSKLPTKSIRATFTDNDQVINATIKQSVTSSFDSVVVACNTGQESSETNLLNISDISIVPGTNHIDTTTLSSTPALSIKSVSTSGSEAVQVKSFKASASDFTCDLQSSSTLSTSVSVIGTTLKTVKSYVGETSDSTLEIDNNFVQTITNANRIRKYGLSYIESSVPTLDITVRGNPRLNLGDVIYVNSAKYQTKYTGRILNAQYEYSGGLTCSMTLVLNIKEV